MLKVNSSRFILQEKTIMQPTVHHIVSILHEYAPPFLAESYDNVGLLVGEPSAPVTGIMVSLDMTEAVLQQARVHNCNVVVAHHPIWFRERKTLIGNDFVSRTIMQAVKEEISLVAVHTNLDNIRFGVNDKIADRIGLTDRQFLRLKKDVPADWQGKAGAGLIGTLPRPMEKQNFLSFIKTAFQCGGIRYADAPKIHQIERVALCGGSGSFLISDAIKSGAQAFMTGDITYHTFFDADERILLADIGHFESEQYTTDLIYDFLMKSLPNFALPQKNIFCEHKTNPVRYF